MIRIKALLAAAALSVSAFSVGGSTFGNQAVSVPPLPQEQQIADVEETNTEESVKPESAMRISVEANGNTVIFELNDSPASKSLYDQLPFETVVENYGSNEKIFYPPQALDITNPKAAEGPAGTLAYFSPWGDIVMYYASFGAYSGLYELGYAVSGGEFIEEMTGILMVEKVEE